MPITLPTFQVQEKLTAEKLNELRNAIEAKFAGGISPADWTWPFVVQGNIDFAGAYGITSLKTFWNIINIQEWVAAGGTLQTAMDSLQSAGGGCAFIPPDYTLTTNGITINSSSVAIVGSGPSSILKLSNPSTSGWFFTTSTGGLTDIYLANFALDGQSSGTGQAGIIAQRITRFMVDRLHIKNFTGPFIKVTHDGTPGNSCSNVALTNLRLDGGTSATANHILVQDCDGLMISNVVSNTCPDTAIMMEPTGAAGILRDIRISTVQIKSPSARGIAILSASGTVDDKWSRVTVNNCHVATPTGVGIQIGAASKKMRFVSVQSCSVHDGTAGGIDVNADNGLVSANYVYSPGTYGLDLVDSTDVDVIGNWFRSATTTGVDAGGTTGCSLAFNDVRGSATPWSGASATTLRVHENVGGYGAATGIAYADGQTSAIGPASAAFAQTVTIPANTLREGDIIRIVVHCSASGSTDGISARWGATSLGSSGVVGTNSNTIEWLCRVTQTPNQTAVLITQTRSTTTPIISTSSPAIDLTTDNAITLLKGGAADTITVTRFYVTINGGI